MPKCYLTADDTTITEQFKEQIKNNFKTHLNSVINSNIIAIEIKKTHRNDLLQTIENSLVNSQEPIDQKIKWYQQFLKNINMEHHKPIVALQLKIPVPVTDNISKQPMIHPKPLVFPTHQTKRKNEDFPLTGNNNKKRKINPFLGQRQKHQTTLS